MSSSSSSFGLFTHPKMLTTGIVLAAAAATTALVLRLDFDIRTITSMPTAKASSDSTSSMSKFTHLVHKRTIFPSAARIAVGAYPSRRRLKLLGWYLDGEYEQTLDLRGVLEHSLAVEIHLDELAYKIIPRSMGIPCRLDFGIEPKMRLRDGPVRKGQLRLTNYSHWDSAVKAALITPAATKCHTHDSILAKHAGLITAVMDAFGPTLAHSMAIQVDCHELLAHNIPPPGFANCMPQVTSPAPYEEEAYIRPNRRNRPTHIDIAVFADPNDETHVRGLPYAIDMAKVQYIAVNIRGKEQHYLRALDMHYNHTVQTILARRLETKWERVQKKSPPRGRVVDHLDGEDYFSTGYRYQLQQVLNSVVATIRQKKREKARAARLARMPKYIEILPMPTHDDDPEYDVKYNGFMKADGTHTNIPVKSPSLLHHHHVQTALLLQKRGPVPTTKHYVKDASRECELGTDYFGEGYRRLGNAHYNDELKVAQYGLVALYQQCGPEAYQLFLDNKHDAMCYFDQHPEHFEMIKGEPWAVARARWCNNRDHVTPVPAEAPVAQPAAAPEIEGEDIDQEILADPAILKIVKKKSPRSSVSSLENQDPFDSQRPHAERFCGKHRASQDAFEQSLHDLAEPQQQSAQTGAGFGLAAQAKRRACKQQAQQSAATFGYTFVHDGFQPDHVYAGVDMYREWERNKARADGPPPCLSNTRRPTPEDTPSPTQRPSGYAVRGPSTDRVPPGFAFKSAEERDHNMMKCVAPQYNDKNYGTAYAQPNYIVHEGWVSFQNSNEVVSVQ
ncbi:hypothetical protein BKA63DRAFT_486315 [Paraphoma chrysanthemicola]|nr:hypothetical protein BKA63DRAFT_486315 [Paraphoma chrysanthemicola]